MQEDISVIFRKADKDNSGTLTVKEVQEVIYDICERYPQVELYLKNKHMSSIVDLLKESKGDVAKESIELDIEELKRALSEVDSQMKNLPATAQVFVNEIMSSSSFYVYPQGHMSLNDSKCLVDGISGCSSARCLSC